MWHKRKCHCWHRTDMLTKFLDGLSPQEAVEQRFKIPLIKKQFNQLNREHQWSRIEWAARQESFLWEHYGHRLFILLDLSQPELWEKYSFFIEEYYRLDPEIYNPGEPFPGFIC